jgi:hypothetical protein
VDIRGSGSCVAANKKAIWIAGNSQKRSGTVAVTKLSYLQVLPKIHPRFITTDSGKYWIRLNCGLSSRCTALLPQLIHIDIHYLVTFIITELLKFEYRRSQTIHYAYTAHTRCV